MKPIREVKLASAGTGKTFSLSNIFLHLYTQGVELDAILASTFTRKAAAEILKRLFERLVEGVNNPDKLDELKRHDAIPKTWARDDAKLCAIRLGQSINKIQVLTLDSYFNGIATQFRSELELPLQWGLSNEQQELAMLQQAIVEHISTLNLDEFAIEASILTGKGAPRDFLETLSKASRSLLNFIKDSHPDAWDCIDAKTCDTTPEDLLARIDALGPIVEDSRAASRKKKIIAAIKSGNATKILTDTTFNNGKFFNKAIDTEWLNIINDIRAYATALATQDVHHRNQQSKRLFVPIQERLNAIREQNSLFSFDDITRLVADAVVGGKISINNENLHLLLDEFQDTSVLQWRILEKQIAASIKANNTLFTVGDVKQAIYGWRSGDSRLLSGLKDWAENTTDTHLNETPLDKNYRSRPIILSTTDMIFSNYSDRDAISDWCNQYPSQSAKKTELGSSLVFEIDKETTKELGVNQSLATAAAIRAADLHHQAPDKSIAVLVTQNKLLPMIQDQLRQRGVECESNGEVFISDAEAVTIVLSWFTAVYYPENTMAKFHVSSSSLTTFGDSEQLSDDNFGQHAMLHRKSIASLGVAKYLKQHLEDLYKCFDSGHDRNRLQQLLDLAYRFDKIRGSKAIEFVDFVSRTKASDNKANKVELMTIHRAKGLEFDAVILPELNSKLTGEIHRETAIGVRGHKDNVGPYTDISVYPSSEYKDVIPKLDNLKNEFELVRKSESLSKLYVALTRAVERLEIIMLEPPQKSKVEYLSNVVRDGLKIKDAPAIKLNIETEDLMYCIWEHPDNDLSVWAQAPEVKNEVVPSTESPFTNSNSSLLLKRVSPSQAGGSLVQGAQLFNPSNLMARHRGSKLHAELENCEWLDSFTTEDQELLQILNKEHVREKLTRPDSGEYQVWCEKEYCVLINEDKSTYISRGCFDRVVISLKDGIATSAEIIDFKTGSVNETARLKYQTQLDEYKKALSVLLGLDLSLISACLLELDS